MKSDVIRFPRQRLRIVLGQPRRPAADAHRVRRDPLLLIVIGMDALALAALFGFWWMFVRQGA